MNKVLVSGYVGKEPTIKTTTSGKKVATFPIAVNDGWGERQQTYWHNVVAWEKKADFVEKYVHKGTKLYVSGKLTSRSYEAQDGSKKYVTEIVADPYDGIDLAGGKGGPSQDEQSQTPQQETMFGGSVSDDDIPF